MQSVFEPGASECRPDATYRCQRVHVRTPLVNVLSLQCLTLQQSFLVQHFMYRYIFLQSYFCLVTIIKCTLKLVQSNKSTIYSAVIAWQQSWAVLLNKLHSYVNPTLSAVELRAHCMQKVYNVFCKPNQKLLQDSFSPTGCMRLLTSSSFGAQHIILSQMSV